MVRPLLTAVAELDGDGGDILRGLARCHLAMLGPRGVEEGKAAEGEREEEEEEGAVAAGKAKQDGADEGEEEKGKKAMAGAWGIRSLSLDSTSGESTASITTTESCCAAGEEAAGCSWA